MQRLDSELRAVMTTSGGLVARVPWVMGAAVSALGLGVLAEDQALRLGLLVTGMTLGFFGLAIWIFSRLATWRRLRNEADLFQLVGEDATPCFATDEQGQIVFRNHAAHSRFGERAVATLVAHLHEIIASPGATLFRLQSRAASKGAAREDLVTRQGHLRLSVHRLEEGRFLWRMEEFQDRSANGRGAEGLSLPMVVANRNGVVLFSNEAMRRLLGERPKRLDRIFLQPNLTSGEEVQIAAAEGTVRAILAEVSGPGERREIFLLPSPDRSNDEVVPVDFENVPVPLLKFSYDGNLRHANRAARDLLGSESLMGLAFHDLFEGLGRPVTDWLRDVVEERLPAGAEVLQVRGPSEEVFVQVQLRRIVELGRAGVLAILSDATALKRLELQFNQSQKMQAIGQLAGGIAHDFNNLLTAISGHCDLLLLRRDREDGDFADLEQIRQNSNRAASLVSQLLAFSRKQTLKLDRLDLHDMLSDLTHLLNRLVGERIQLKFSHDPELGPVRADRRRLEQVMMNLVVNARDAMPKGGEIRIETGICHFAEPVLRDRVTLPAGDYSVIRVRDAGCGIAPDKIDKIFDPFFTTKRPGEGTGLGLSTVYGIMKQSGGYVFVDSTVGTGTCFELMFPVYHPTDAALAEPQLAEVIAPAASASTPERQGEGVILLVEDEAPVRAFASRALRMKGYTVLEAENAEDALQTLKDPALVVDVFVTDVVMPGLDGPTWVKLALESRPGARVVFVSGYAEDHVTEDQRRIPNSVFLAKPFSLNELTATVEGQLLN